MSPKVKVEVNFAGPDWVDLSAYLLLSEGIPLSEGRDNEAGDAVNPGSLSLALLNADGWFSPDLPSSPYYPDVKPGAGLRVSVWADGAWRCVHKGQIQAWATDWASDVTGKRAIVRVTSTDSLGAFPSHIFRQASDEAFRVYSAIVGHWSLRGDLNPLIGSIALTDNGSTDGDGLGGLLPMDEGTDAHPLLKSGSGGRTIYLKGLSTDPYWAVYLVVMSEPTANCRIMTAGADGVDWDSAAGFKFAGHSTGLPTSWPAILCLANSFVGGSWLVYRSAGGAGGGTVSSTMRGPLRQVTINPTLAGGATWGVGHLAIESDPSGSVGGIVDELVNRLVTTDRVLPNTVLFPLTVPKYLTVLSGSSAAINGTIEPMRLPLLEGRDAADVMSALVTGMGARLVDNHDGTLNWVPFAPNTTPVAIPSGTVLNDLVWLTDASSWCSDCTVTRPDSTTYTATRPDGKRQTISIEGVHATAAADNSYADWLVNAGSFGARCPSVTVNMLSPILTEAQRAALVAAIPGTRISLAPGLVQMPSTVLGLVEGRDINISPTAWTITYKLSPDIYSRLFILDDAAAGLLDSAYILAP